MLTHPTHDRLVALGLTGMAKALEEQRKQPDLAALGFEERLALMVDREAIERCDIGGMTQQAFAELEGLSLSGAKSRVQRARQRLRAQLLRACQVQLDEHGRVCCFVPRPPL